MALKAASGGGGGGAVSSVVGQIGAVTAAQIATGLTSADLSPRSIDAVLYCDQFASLQACHDALPTTGGKIMLPPNTTYVVTSTITISKPNVTIEGPGWGTVLKRGTATGQVIYLTGANATIKNCTIDGNGTVFPGNGNGDIQLGGVNNLAWNIQSINSGGSIAVGLSGANSRIAYSTVTGLSSATVGGYGIWAIGHVTVTIDHNTVSGTRIDGIGFDGAGSQVSNNTLFGNQCAATVIGSSGGQIVAYPGYGGMLISGNTLGQGGAAFSNGVESNANSVTISSNTLNNQTTSALTIDPGAVGALISGNTIRNSGQTGGGAAAIIVQAGGKNITIVGNRIIDDQATKTTTTGLLLTSGAQDYLVVQGNDFFGIATPISDSSSGLNKTLSGNLGVDNVVPSIASASVLPVPLNPVFTVTGTAGIFWMQSAPGITWTGRSVTIIPTGVIVFTAGNNIANGFTTTAGVPVQATFDGSLWHFGATSTFNNGLVTATSATVARTLADRFAQTYDARDFGTAIWDGANDVAPAINAAITAVKALGGGIITVPRGVWPIASTIALNVTGVNLLGQGHNNGSSPVVTLLWTGGLGGTMMQIGTTSADIYNAGIKGILLDCNQANGSVGQARRGLYMVRAWSSDTDVAVREPFVNVAATSPQAVAIEIGYGVNLGRLRFTWVMQSALVPTGAAIAPINSYTFPTYPVGLWIHGTLGASSGNSSYTEISVIGATSTVGIPVWIDWADHLTFPMIDLYTGAQTTPGVLFNNCQAVVNRADIAPGGCTIVEYGGGLPIQLMGTGTNITAPADIRIEKNDSNNGTPSPIIGTGAGCIWRDDTGRFRNLTNIGPSNLGAVTADSVSVTNALGVGGTAQLFNTLIVGWQGSTVEQYVSISTGAGHGVQYYLSPNGQTAWGIGSAGTNSGNPSDLIFPRYNNTTSALIDTPISFSSATGRATFNNGITGTLTGNASGNLLLAGGTLTGGLIGTTATMSGAVQGLTTVASGAANTLTMAGSATTTPVRFTASGTDTNIGVAVVPKGTGAFSLAVPDSTTVGGNARGANAIDLQTVRSLAAQVASGVNSAILGGSNNAVSGANASIIGGLNIAVSGSRSSAGGENVNVSGGDSFGFGYNNSVQGNYSAAFGANHTLSNSQTFAMGNGNSASGVNSFVIGNNSTDNGRFSIFAFASSGFSTRGDAQAASQILRVSTSAATSARLTADAGAAGAANIVNIPNNAAYTIKTLTITGRDTTTGDAATWYLAAPSLILRKATVSTTTLPTAITLTAGPNSGTGSVAAMAVPTVTADTTNGGLNVSLTPAAANLSHWVCEVTTVEVQ